MKTLSENINIEIFSIFKELMIKYTRGQSSSIKEDSAVNILSSIYYSINTFIKNYKNRQNFSSLMSEKGVSTIYKEGLKILESCVEDCRICYEYIKENKLNIPLEVYNDTVDVGLCDFFNNYDIIFDAQDIPCSMDYPLIFDDMNMKGIFYIKQYLEKLKIETEFCNLFTQSSIRKILRNYGKKYRINIIKSPINVFEVLLQQSVFIALSKSNEKTLEISVCHVENITRILFQKSDDELICIINKAFKDVIEKFNIKNKKLVDYIGKCRESFTIRFLAAYESGNILNMIIMGNKKFEKHKIVFNEGKKMNDYRFAYIVDAVMKCPHIKDKLNIICSNLHSLEDYIDLLDSQCLFGDEYIEVFKVLDDMSLAVLGKTVFYDDLRCNSFELSSERLLKCKNNMESEWQNYYVEFLLGLQKNRIENIEKIIVKIDIDEDLM
ncbi:DUF6179 domain-containing protein [Clostridium sp. WILCCON 0269]|uniref:DUF6179 domain-containing protein n=1 Tax=Candidatus Clostridium eludens TaxID=3381663 RepID=A0ABW8SLE8_9CLOT